MIFKSEYGYSTAISNKNQDGEYENMYLSVQLPKGVELENKTMIEITWVRAMGKIVRRYTHYNFHKLAMSFLLGKEKVETWLSGIEVLKVHWCGHS